MQEEVSDEQPASRFHHVTEIVHGVPPRLLADNVKENVKRRDNIELPIDRRRCGSDVRLQKMIIGPQGSEVCHNSQRDVGGRQVADAVRLSDG